MIDTFRYQAHQATSRSASYTESGCCRLSYGTGCSALWTIGIGRVAATLTGRGRSFSRSSCKRSFGTSPVVPCTRALATRCSRQDPWGLESGGLLSGIGSAIRSVQARVDERKLWGVNLLRAERPDVRDVSRPGFTV